MQREVEPSWDLLLLMYAANPLSFPRYVQKFLEFRFFVAGLTQELIQS